MEFTLVYRGPLRANGGIQDKQAIRRAFHKQLKNLWKLPPLQGQERWLDDNPPENDISIVQKVRDFRFAPLINQKLALVAEIDINMLRPEAPGKILTQGGDIDNRLKTLFDSFRMPKTTDEIPKKDNPKEDENPFFCLLEDDNLITKVSVVTDRLLEPYDNDSFVVLVIKVRTRVTVVSCDTIDFA